jgi:hypothetical protein
MTVETKTYIGLADILGLRLQCKNCKCSLLLETESDEGTINNILASHNVVLTKCPTCGHPWTEVNNQRMCSSEIKQLFRQIRDLKKMESIFGCALSLDIAEEKKP